MHGLEIQNEFLSVKLVPELGGKVVSLVNRRSNREWLWKNNRIPYRQAATEHSYTELHDTGGMDECFPSVAPCTLPAEAGTFAGLTLPDHGELFARPWEMEVCEITADRAATLTLSRRCQILPCNFRRTVTLAPDEGRVHMHYRVHNRGEIPMPFSWCLHPALAVQPGMKLLLPQNHQLRCSFASDNAPLSTGDVFRWPLAPGGADMSVIPEVTKDDEAENGYAAKLLSATDLHDCTSAGNLALAGLENPTTGERLHFVLPPEEVPHLALWLNYRGWAGDGGAPYFNLVLEPAIGNADSLRELVEQNAAPMVPPGSSREWSFEIRIDNP